MRIWGRVALGGIAALASSFVITIPAGAALSHSGVSDTCPEVLAGSPTGGVRKRTVPVDGSEVRRGDVVAVTLRWDTATFTSPVLHKALDCVTIDGALVDRLSTQERDTPNDGRFETHFTVPGDLADGTRLCDRGFVSGPGDDNGFAREKSNDVCFTVRGDIPATVPAPAETSPVAAQTPVAPAPPPGTLDAPEPEPPPGSSLTAPVDSATPIAAPIPAPVGAGPAGQGRPGREIGPDAAVLGAQDVLPRTGSAVEGLVRLAALSLLLGGLCLLVSPKRAHTL